MTMEKPATGENTVAGLEKYSSNTRILPYHRPETHQNSGDCITRCSRCSRATNSLQLFAVVMHPATPIVLNRFCARCAAAHGRNPLRSPGGAIPRRPVTVVDVLLARALAKAFFDLDYAEEIEFARKLAAWGDGRAAA
jgi:hypothetical protein